MKEIVRLHRVKVLDRDQRFTLAFWHEFWKALGTRLDFNTVFHPQTDGQTEHLNQILEDMLRVCVLDFKRSWDSNLHVMKFSYNNNFQATIRMAPFVALYGKRCRSLLSWDEVDDRELVEPKLVRVTNKVVQKI